MSKKYEPELIRKIVQLHLEEGRTYKSITDEQFAELELVPDFDTDEQGRYIGGSGF